MIISHTHKFLFVKSIKTAGTSIEAALSQHCSGDDVVTPLNNFSHNRDESGGAVHRAMNAETLPWWNKEIGQHVDAAMMKAHLPPEVWRTYVKISIARNPWDRMVSLFTWRTRNDPSVKPRKRFYHWLGVPYDEMAQVRRHFAEFVRLRTETNDRFYVMDGGLCVDHVVRYESIGEDMKALSERLGVSEMTLPRLKTGIRPGSHHYSAYYDESTRAHVERSHANDISLFGYRFERA